MKITIEKPIIKKEKGYCFLQANIKTNEFEYPMWYKVEEKYGEYLCDDNCNAFLIALIPYIIKHEYDTVIIEGKISSRLYYQITNYLLPLICKEFNKKQPNIQTELTDKKYNGIAVGASMSRGVDSFYTLLKHKNQKDFRYNITHLTFFNVGSHGEYDAEKAFKLYMERLEDVKKFCDEYNYNLVTVDSNMNELIMMDHQKTNTFRTLACVFALEKLFGKYYFASCLNFNGSRIDEFDTATYDILNVHTLTNENISFYCSGMETSRFEKVKYISDFEETYNYLNVCVKGKDNCGLCEKCIRTMTALDSIGKLEKYKSVFPVDYFNKHKIKIYKEMYIISRDKNKKELYQEVKSFSHNKKKIIAYILSFIPNRKNVKIFIKNILPDSILLKIKKVRKRVNPKLRDGWTD